MSERKRPPCRRPSVTRALVWQTENSEHHFHVTFGLDVNTAHPIEVFYADGQRVGSQLQHAIQDACVVISVALQHGVQPSAVAKSLSTTTIFGAIQPATVIGVIAAALKAEAPEV